MGSRQQNERRFTCWQDLPGGGRRYWIDVHGRMGWRARYVKEVDVAERTRRFWQEIYDPDGQLIEVHEKYPVDRGHRKKQGIPMKITRQSTARKLNAYLQGRIPLPVLVEWAERAMLQGDFEPKDAAVLKKVVPRLGLADVRSFGLEWSDCSRLLRLLGFRARIDVVAA